MYTSWCRREGKGGQGWVQCDGAGAPLQPQGPLCRHRVGQDPTLPTHTLLLGDGHVGSGPLATKVPLTAASQRFYHILHVAASAGEHEKVVQVTMLYLKPLRGAEGQEASIRQCFSSPDSGTRFRWC